MLGPSGCGKTTTLRIIAGFETPDSGAVRIGAEILLDIAPHRRGMGVVFQNYASFPHLTAWNNIAFGMRIAGRSAAKVHRRVPELLALVGLQDAGSKYPRELSGGRSVLNAARSETTSPACRPRERTARTRTRA
jgi:putative spermidine/putrescine transport system ATP-binding protein